MSMRRLLWLAGATLAASGALGGEAATPHPSLVVHEWGVWVRGTTAMGRPTLAGPAELAAGLPAFVHRLDRQYTPRRQNHGWDKPVLHFYGAEGLSFHAACLSGRRGTWQIHGGVLRLRDYSEWHVGGGCAVGLDASLQAMGGLRVFGIDGTGPRPARWAGTLLVAARPTWLSRLELSGGIVDATDGIDGALRGKGYLVAVLGAGRGRLEIRSRHDAVTLW